MAAGVVGALGGGLLLPLFSIVFGGCAAVLPEVLGWVGLSTLSRGQLTIHTRGQGATRPGPPFTRSCTGDFINAFGDPSNYDFLPTINTLALKFIWLAIAGAHACGVWVGSVWVGSVWVGSVPEGDSGAE